MVLPRPTNFHLPASAREIAHCVFVMVSAYCGIVPVPLLLLLLQATATGNPLSARTSCGPTLPRCGGPAVA